MGVIILNMHVLAIMWPAARLIIPFLILTDSWQDEDDDEEDYIRPDSIDGK